MNKCRNADKYKAMRPPKCGCDVCLFKWKIGQLELKYAKLAEALGEADDQARSAGAAASAALYVANYCK